MTTDNTTSTPAPGEASRKKMVRWFVALALGCALAMVLIVALLVNIFERKQEAKNPFFRVVELTDATTDPAVWGKNSMGFHAPQEAARILAESIEFTRRGQSALRRPQ